MAMFSIQQYPLRGKTVLLRVDYNVPLKNGKIVDNSKIKATLPTIRFLREQRCKIILMTHLGKPEGIIHQNLRLNPLREELHHLLKLPIHKLNDCIGKTVREKIGIGKPGDIFMLENLRFYAQEETDNPIFAHALASLGEVYINDAFAVSHRKHASVHAITHFLPAIPGFLMEKELLYLRKALHPEHPCIWIMGGGKFDKVDLLEQALRNADYVLLGGALAFPFLKAKGIPIGMSRISADAVETAREILRSSQSKKLVLPVDFAVAGEISQRAKVEMVDVIPVGKIGLDLGPATIKLFTQYLHRAKMIVWNGPLGYFELVQFATSTKEIGRSIGKLTATSIAGGGETVEALHKFNLADKFTHLSTGGGAALEFLAGKKLPGIVALEENWKKFGEKEVFV